MAALSVAAAAAAAYTWPVSPAAASDEGQMKTTSVGSPRNDSDC